MAFMFLVCFCYTCGHLFTCNPDLVPSLPVDGIKEPICRACINAANPKRIANGLTPIVPLPGAYGAQEVA